MSTTGPYTLLVNQPKLYILRRWYRQKPPFPSTGRPPSDFKFVGASVTTSSGSYPKPDADDTAAGYNAAYLIENGSDRARVINKAYANFRNSVNEKAMTLVNLAERRQAVSMVENSCNRMLRVLSLLSKGRRAAAMKALGLNVKGPWYSHPKDAGNIWLEWHFGWAPLLQDIHSSISILESDWASATVRGKAGISTNTGTVSRPPGSWDDVVQNRIFCLVQADVRINNPNLAKASSLGLINPLSVAWELIPFSFLVDWFVPVSGFLESFTDFVGMSLNNAFTTVYVVSTSSQNIQSTTFPELWGVIVCNAAGVRRTLGFSGPMVRFLPPRSLSVTRAATSVALLLQQLSRVHLNSR